MGTVLRGSGDCCLRTESVVQSEEWKWRTQYLNKCSPIACLAGASPRRALTLEPQ
jgi:hypothetical protein